MSICIWMWQ